MIGQPLKVSLARVLCRVAGRDPDGQTYDIHVIGQPHAHTPYGGYIEEAGRILEAVLKAAADECSVAESNVDQVGSYYGAEVASGERSMASRLEDHFRRLAAEMRDDTKEPPNE